MHSTTGGEAVQDGISLASIPQQGQPALECLDGVDSEPSVERARLLRRQHAAEGSAASERTAVLALAAGLRRRVHASRHARHQFSGCAAYAPAVFATSLTE